MKMSWSSNNGIQSYDASKFEKVGNFYAPTCPIFAGSVTYTETLNRQPRNGHIQKLIKGGAHPGH